MNDYLVKSIDTTMDELKKRKTQHRNEYIVKGILFLFFLLNSSFWNTNLETDEDLKRRRQKFEYSIFKLLAKYKMSLIHLVERNFYNSTIQKELNVY